MQPIITLTTDFGTRDAYVAAMKGVILGRLPGATLVDLSHQVPAGDVLRGALVLDAATRFFPRGCVHLAVVDPGVGTARDLLVVRATGSTWLAPDNGLLTRVLARHPGAEALRVTDHAGFALAEVSRTFHGRDLFAPLAAGLAGGTLNPARFTAPTRPVLLEGLAAVRGAGRVEGRVLHADRFGNLITNVGREDVEVVFGAGRFAVRLNGRRLGGLLDNYQEGRGLELFPLWGSEGLLELARTGAPVPLEPDQWGPVVLTQEDGVT